MSELEKLMYWRGIASDYINYEGHKVDIPFENRKLMLKTMGVDLSASEAITQEVYDRDIAPWLSWLPSFHLTYQDNANFELNLPPELLHLVFEATV